ncbi:MAG TPA: hypothetical protein VFY71_02295, partial [Planctomycetota bacterium]|nr:hypothetical protein [Planctomycetota bacterium]
MSRAPLMFAAGVLAGAGVAVLVTTVDGGSSAPDDALSRSLDAIETQLRSLGQALADRPAPSFALPAEQAQPAPMADPRLDDILARLDALQLLVTTSRAAPGETAAEAPPSPDAPRISEPLPDKLPDTPPDLAAFANLTGHSMTDLTQQHQLWTYAQVGDAYGRPTRVAPSPGGVGIKYYYELANGHEFIFWFTDGKVVGAFWADE